MTALLEPQPSASTRRMDRVTAAHPIWFRDHNKAELCSRDVHFPALHRLLVMKSTDSWRARTLAHVRTLIKQADPDVVEQWKWVKPTSPGVPVWSHDGIICTGEVYKDKVKLTFAKGASLPDPSRLFNSSLDGNLRRAIDLREG